MENQLNYVKSILLGQLLLEANDQLKGTNRYKQSIKQQVNKVNEMLEPIAKAEYDKLYSVEVDHSNISFTEYIELLKQITLAAGWDTDEVGDYFQW